MRWFVITCFNPTCPDSKRRAWNLAHLAVRQQAAVGVGAGLTAPLLIGGVGLRQLPWGHDGDQRAGAAWVNPPSRRPPFAPKTRPGARAGLWCSEPLQLGGEVLVWCCGGLGVRVFFFWVCTAASWCGSRLWGDGGRGVFTFYSLPLLLFAAARREEGTNVVLLFSLKL